MIKQCCAPLEDTTADELIKRTGKKNLKEALTEAVAFTIARYQKEKEKAKKKEPEEDV